MIRASRCRKPGFTLVELLIVVAIVAMLISMVLWAVQRMRDAAARATCIHNMKQIGLAVQAFHDKHGQFPVYNGIFPYKSSGDVSQLGDTKAVYGSYYVHLLPYLDQPELYNAIRFDVANRSNTGNWLTSIPGAPGTPAQPGGPLLVAATPGSPAVYDYTGLTWVPGTTATYNNWLNTRRWVTTDVYVQSPTSQNGAVVWVKTTQSGWVPSQYPDPGTANTNGYWARNVNGVLVGPVNPPLIRDAVPGTSNVYGAPGPPVPAGPAGPTRYAYTGTFKAEYRGARIPALICPSDPSTGNGEPNANAPGMVYTGDAAADPWSSANYLANWNVFATANASRGFRALPRTPDAIGDGNSNTVMMAEGYAWCDGKGRTAFIAWHENDPSTSFPNGGLNVGGVHNFGLTGNTSPSRIQGGTRPAVESPYSTGFPNPSGSPELIFEFQIQPRPLPFGNPVCQTANANCCNNLTVQTGHSAGINITLCDGSVRTLRSGMTLDTWRALLLPNDGNVVPGDW
jgi:prepilin-type N-terminal cleavage/methylation domain-containing protein